MARHTLAEQMLDIVKVLALAGSFKGLVQVQAISAAPHWKDLVIREIEMSY